MNFSFSNADKVSAVIVAAGRGRRMGEGIDKLWLEVAGRPVIAHTWEQFNDSPSLQEIILVIRDGMQDQFHDLARRYAFKKPYRLVLGGMERQDSVWNGLSVVSPDAALVAIQDGARPCTSQQLIADTIQRAIDTGAAVAAHQVIDTLKESLDGTSITRTVDRTGLWAVQTPQVFRLEIIRKAIATARGKNLILTDDTAACELIGQPVQLVKSTAPNPKVTVSADLPLIESLLRSRH